MAITAKHLYGWRLERILHPYLEDAFDEPLTPTKFRFDGCDLTSENHIIEIKARPKYSVKYGTLQTKDSYKTWVIPTCKIDKYNPDNPQDLWFIYYWGADQECFALKYDAEKFKNYERGVPFWTSQEHFFIPAEEWESFLTGVSDEE